MRLDRVSLTPGNRHFGTFMINEIYKVGGNDSVVGGGIRNEEPVIMSGPWHIKLPTHTRMFTTYAGGWWVIFIALRRCLRGVGQAHLYSSSSLLVHAKEVLKVQSLIELLVGSFLT
jgi:hypothetical protein